jgi:AcrR family transcriptional regulator
VLDKHYIYELISEYYSDILQPRDQDGVIVKPLVKTAGRPRSLTLEDVLDAAIDLGLGGISMAALATKLGVGTATIYNYVTSRADLIRLAAVRQGKRPRFDDLGQHWTDLARDHAIRFYDLCAAEPELTIQHMQGLTGPEAQMDYLEAFLAALVRRGFQISEAFHLYSALNLLVHGAVVRSAYARALRSQGRDHEIAVRVGLASRPPDELPHVRACADFLDQTSPRSFEKTLERLIESFARERA